MTIEVAVSSNSQAANRDLEKLTKTVNGIGTAVDGVTDKFRNMVVGIGSSLLTLGTVTTLVNLSDSLTALKSKLSVAASSADNFSKSLSDVKKIALSTTQELDAVATLYSKISMSASNLGATQREVAVVTQSISKAIALSGANTQETASAVLQLGQALASGRLQGDELRAILESAPQLAKAIADGIGVTVAEMRQLGSEGKLVSKDIFGAILKQTNQINTMFRKVNVTFGMAFTNIKNSAKVLFDAFNGLGSGFDYGVTGAGNGTVEKIKTLADRLNDVAIAIYNLSQNLEDTFLRMQQSLWLFMDDLVKLFMKLPQLAKQGFKGMSGEAKSASEDAIDSISELLGSPTKSFKIAGLDFKIDLSKIFKIRLDDWIPKLWPMAEEVQSFTKVVERAFFWVYDRVIGHSWIPDLVEGVIVWMSLLTGKPIDYVKELTNYIDKSLKNILEFFTGSSKDTASAPGPVKALKEMNVAAKKESNIFEKITEDITTSWQDMSSALASTPVFKAINESFNLRKNEIATTAFMRNLRQSMSTRDTAPGTYESRAIKGGISAYDNNSFVARGTHRNQESRPFLHDITSAFKSENQIPFLSVVFTSMTAGIVAAFATGSVIKGIGAAILTGTIAAVGGVADKMVPLGLLIGGGILLSLQGSTATKIITALMTTAFGLSAANIVPDREISLTTQGIVRAIFEGLTKAVKLLFGEGLMGEKGIVGTLTLIAKMALLFASGRELLGKMVKALALSPMAITDGLADRGEKRAIDAKIRNNEAAIARSTESGSRAIKSAQNQMLRIRDQFSKMVGPSGNQLGTLGVRQMTQYASGKGDTTANEAWFRSLGQNARDTVLRYKDARSNLNDAGAAQQNIIKNNKELQQNTEALKSNSAKLGEKISDANNAMREGSINALAGIGGIFGSLIGFNLGADIADKMTNSPDWAKVGVQMSAAFAGQLIGSGIGQVIARSVIMFLSPAFIGIAALIGIAIAAAINFEGLKETFNTLFVVAKTTATVIYDKLVEVSKPWVKSLESVADSWVKTLSDKFKQFFGFNTSTENKALENALDDINKIRSDFKSNKAIAQAKGDAAAVDKLNKGLDKIDSIDADLRDKLKKNNGAYEVFNDPITSRFTSGSNVAGDSWQEQGAITKMLGWSKYWSKVGTYFKDAWSNTFKLLDQNNPGRLVLEKVFSGISGTSQSADLSAAEAIHKQAIAAKERPDITAAVSKAASRAERATKDFSVVSSKQEIDATAKSIPEEERLKAFTQFISRMEGTSKYGFYTQYGGSQLPSLNEHPNRVGRFDSRTGKEADSNTPVQYRTSAAGAAQFLRGTWDDLSKKTGVKDFSPESQYSNLLQMFDDLGVTASILNGNWSKVIEKIPKIWTSMPGATGPGSGAHTWTETSKIAKMTTFDMANKTDIFSKANIQTGAIEATKKKSDKAINKLQDGLTDAADNIKKTVQDWAVKLKLIAPELVGPPDSLANNYKKEKPAPQSTLSEQLKFAYTLEESAQVINKALTNLGINTITEQALSDKSTPALQKLIEEIDAYISYQNRVNEAEGFWPRMAVLNQFPAEKTLARIRFTAKEMQNPQKDAATKKGYQMYEGSEQYGQEAAIDFSKSFSEAFTSRLKGQSSNKAFFSKIADTFTTKIIDGFSKGLTDSLSKSIMGTISKTLFAGGFDIGGSLGQFSSKALGGVSDFLFGYDKAPKNTPGVDIPGVVNPNVAIKTEHVTGVLEPLTNQLKEVGNTLLTSITEGMSKLPSFFNDMFGNIDFSSLSGMFDEALAGLGDMAKQAMDYIKLLFLADGGYVSGPGTSTSDSIPARLSNGEFVINAQSTRRFRPLLEKINSGKVPKFSTGGLVGNSTFSESTALSNISKSSNGDNRNTVINLNITGDISRQTRSQIFEMIPSIADGVNNHNREKGYRR